MILQIVFHIIILVISPLAYAQNGRIAQPGCSSTCGNVDIPFPFGMKDHKCYVDKMFEIECRRNTSEGFDKPYLKSLNLEVSSIDAGGSMVEIMNPIYRSNCHSKSNNSNTVINLRGSPFVYSQEQNSFLAVGCNNIAFLQSNGTEVGGCVSICDNNEEVNNNNNNFDLESDGCHGKYCCETSLPAHLSEYSVTLEILGEQSVGNQSNHDGCGYSLIVSKYWIFGYNFDDLKIMEYVPATLEWEILNHMLINSTMQLPSDSYCSDSNITSSSNRTTGKRCYCSSYSNDGNPYVAGGCRPAYTPDNYVYYKNNHKNNRGMKPAIVGVSSSLGSIVLLYGLWRLYKVVKKKMIKKRKENFFKKNGGLLLQQRMSSGEVNIDKTTLFSLKDLKKATENFNMNRVLGKGGQGTVYKGMLVDGRIVAVKKFKVEGNVEEFINEFVILSQINNRNVVKLLGCCLETKIPLLVYEFIPNGNLFEYLHNQIDDLPMTWDMRLRIAAEIAGALFYLHSIASQPIYHRDVKTTNILLDEKYRAKLADFGASRIISIEATHLTTVVQGTFGYLDPEYFHTSQFTEKSDAYSFGVVLAELLTGQKPISSAGPGEYHNLSSYFVHCVEENILFDIIDKRVTNEGDKEHIITVANLAKRCLELNGRKRPTMKEVMLELEGIRGSNMNSNTELNNEEIELVGIEKFPPRAGYSASNSMSILSNLTHSSDSEVMHILATK